MYVQFKKVAKTEFVIQTYFSITFYKNVFCAFNLHNYDLKNLYMYKKTIAK